VIAVSRDFVLAGSNNFDRVLAHQPAYPALPNIEAK
jgi:hypothetical protein